LSAAHRKRCEAGGVAPTLQRRRRRRASYVGPRTASCWPRSRFSARGPGWPACLDHGQGNVEKHAVRNHGSTNHIDDAGTPAPARGQASPSRDCRRMAVLPGLWKIWVTGRTSKNQRAKSTLQQPSHQPETLEADPATIGNLAATEPVHRSRLVAENLRLAASIRRRIIPIPCGLIIYPSLRFVNRHKQPQAKIAVGTSCTHWTYTYIPKRARAMVGHTGM
jgi:hypothetical protein